MTILFVCTGNTCRSPTAEAIFRHMLQKEKIENVDVFSRGVGPLEGQPISEGAALALKAIGLEAPVHRSARLRDEDLERADLILVMDESHLKRVQTLYPEAVLDTFLLKEYAEADGDVNIEDPMGGSPEDYEESRIEIQNALLGLLTKIKRNHP